MSSSVSDFLKQAYEAYAQQNWALAEQYFRVALLIDESGLQAQSYVMLGNACLQQNKLHPAIQAYEAALKLHPTEYGICLNLGQAYYEAHDLKASEQAFRSYLKTDPEHIQAWYLLARTYHKAYWLFHEAQCLEEIHTRKPNEFHAFEKAWSIWKQLAHWDKAQDYSHEAKQMLQARLSNTQKQSLLNEQIRYVYTLPAISDQALLAECQRLFPQTNSKANIKTRSAIKNGKTRIGYLSREFGTFASMQILRPLFQHHCSDFELIAYDDTPTDLSTHQDLDPYFSQWREIQSLSNQQVAQLIEQDTLDILVDLAGISHTSRQELYQLKASPIQVSGLGFVFSSGLAAFDYCLSDRFLCPPDLAKDYSENVHYLSSALHWQPPQDWALTDLPCLQNGSITLGSASTLNKLNPQVIVLWSQLLRILPEAILFLKTPALEDPLARQWIQVLFAQQGIPAERLRLEGAGQAQHVPYFYSQIDIALDPFPYQGGVTTCESLWMGVPVITLFKPQWQNRALSASIYHHLGLADWITHSEADYLQKALDWSQNPNSLKDWRQTLREHLQQSIICDGALFAREVETAYQAFLGT